MYPSEMDMTNASMGRMDAPAVQAEAPRHLPPAPQMASPMAAQPSLFGRPGGFVHRSTVFALTMVLFGFVLAAALAWTDAVKYFIRMYVQVPTNLPMYQLVYAGVVTLLAVLVYMVSQRYLDSHTASVPLPLVGAVGFA